jgi:hypothetical protein
LVSADSTVEALPGPRHVICANTLTITLAFDKYLGKKIYMIRATYGPIEDSTTVTLALNEEWGEAS